MRRVASFASTISAVLSITAPRDFDAGSSRTNRLRSASRSQMIVLLVYSVAELKGLFIQRRIENTSRDELAQGVINEWAMDAESGHAKNLAADFRNLAEKAFEFRNATQWLDNQRRNLELVAEYANQPAADILVGQPSARERAAREAFLSTYKDHLNKRLVSTVGKSGN
jgi:hypothetical protein